MASVTSYGIDQRILRTITVRHYSVLLAMLPIVSSIFGFVVFDQSPTGWDFVGGTLIISGIATTVNVGILSSRAFGSDVVAGLAVTAVGAALIATSTARVIAFSANPRPASRRRATPSLPLPAPLANLLMAISP